MFIVSLVEDAVWQDFYFLPLFFLFYLFIYLFRNKYFSPAQATILAFLVTEIECHE